MWQVWTLLESATKITSSVLQKLAGVAITNPATALVYSGIIGIVQIGAGYQLRRKSVKLVPGTRDLVLSVLCGVLASVANVLGPVAFLYEADLAGRTFLVAMSVVPGMVIGWMIFGQKLTPRQFLSIGLFMLGAWAILDGPNLISLVTNPPTWVWITLIVTLGSAVSEALRNGMSKNYSTMVNNFWVGVTTFVVSFGGYWWLLSNVEAGQMLSDISMNFVWFSILTGIVVAIMISMSLKAYQGGALIALKKVLMTSVYLIGVALIGHFFFAEYLTVLRWVGIALFVVAVFMSDRSAWKLITGQSKE